MKIIVVDDEQDILEETVELLMDSGHSVRSAISVDGGLELLQLDSQVDLIITDLKMPQKSGIDLIDEVFSRYGDIFPIIIISGHGDTENSIKGLNIKKFKLFSKPLNIDLLLSFLSEIQTKSDT